MSDLIQGALPLTAGGTIPTCAFVMGDTTADEQVVAATAGALTLGVSQRWGDGPAFTNSGTTPSAAVAGESITVYGDGVVAQLRAGTGGWTRWNQIKSDASGNGIAVTTTGDLYGAIALSSVPAGGVGPVLVRHGVH